MENFKHSYHRNRTFNVLKQKPATVVGKENANVSVACHVIILLVIVLVFSCQNVNSMVKKTV